jgi:hypothetical protein
VAAVCRPSREVDQPFDTSGLGCFGSYSASSPPPGSSKRSNQAPARIIDRTHELDSLALEFLDGRVDVVAHEVQLVVHVLIRGMGSQLGGRQAKDGPAAPGVDRGELKHLAKENPDTLYILREDDGVGAGDHGAQRYLYSG